MSKPQIRFKGFEDEWEIAPFKSLCTYTASNLTATDAMQSGKYPLFDANKFIGFTDLAHINKSYISIIKDGAGVGRVRALPKDSFIIGTLGALVPNDNSLITFLLPLTSIQNFASHNSGSTIPHIYFSQYGESLVAFPNTTEQGNIGDFFKQIDEMITEVEREVSRLEKMKQASLQKMFPRPGATAPEIRFDGFSGDWQTASFSDVFTQLKNNTLSRACLNYESGTIKNIHYGDVLIKFDSVVDVNSSMVPYINNNIDIELNSFNTLSNGDIIFADTAEDEAVGKCVEIEGADVFDAVSGLHTIAVRPTIEFAQYYLGYFLNSNSYHSQLLPLMQGIKVLSIGRYAMADTKVLYPKSLDEQKAIGEYFRNLDSLLSAKRQKLVKLRNIKQACLDKMFVNTSDL